MFNRNKILLIVLAVLLVSGIGIFWYNKRNSGVVQKNAPSQSEIEKAQRIVELDDLNATLDKMRVTDKDLDGLTAEEEKKFGTDPLKSDTDSDGLLDNDEIKIYKTNPLKADTDGDGKSDGYEVRRYADPLKK